MWQLSDGELTAALLRAQTVLSQGYGRMLELVGEADGRGLGVEKGYRNTATFLIGAMRLSTREAKARVAQATTPMPLTGQALAAGTITAEHVTEIHHVLAAAPEDLDPELRAQGEKTLVDLAMQAAPLSVRQAGKRLSAYWDTATPPKEPKDRAGQPLRRLSWREARDGQLHVTGEVDSETGTFLRGLIDPLATPRPVDEFGREDTRNLEQRRGDAFAEVVLLAANSPDRSLVGGDRALIIVTISLEELERRTGDAFIDGIGYTSIAHLRRLACDANVVPTVLGTRGEVLDLGRARRTVAPAQFRALVTRDRGCARPGCHRKPRYCQAHHVVEWADGGLTDLGNAVLLCLYHHMEVHHGGWSIRMVHGVPEFIPPKWLDQEQIPIRNVAHVLPHEQAA
ncbi:MAG: hypothetical protein QOI21_5627 [Actinomycetota bacterium]|nr:hypothetical protein [Actinomycetota bacterium]